MGKASRRRKPETTQSAVPAALPAGGMPDEAGAPRILPIALFLLTFALFARSLSHDFINYDDPDYVTANAVVQRGLSAEGIRYAFTSLQPYYWQPLTWLSLQLDTSLFGTSARGYLAVNILLHALAVVLLFFLMHRTTRRLWPSAAVAALWAVHPLRVESVAWVAERKDVLSTLLFIATVYVYVRFTERRTLARYLAVVAVFVLALMSKPMVVMLPFVLLLVDVWPLGLKPSIKDKVPLFVLAAAIVAVTFIGQRGAIAGTLPFSIRISNAIINYSAYLGKMVFPVDLAVVYPYRFDIEMGRVVGSVMLLAAITAGVFFQRRLPLISGWLWYLITLAPVAGIVQAGPQSMADRFTYIPSIGLLYGLAFGFAWRKTAAIIAGVAAVILAVTTFVYLGAWQNSITLFNHAIKATGPNALAQMKLGDALMDLERFEEANAAYAEAVRVSNGGTLPLASAGGALVKQKRYAEAIAPLRRALAAEPNNSAIRENLGTALMNSGQAPEAISHFESALKLDGGGRRAEILQGLGDAKRIAGRIDDGITDLRSSIAVRATAEAWNDLGSAYSAKGDLASAEDAFKQALRLKPDFYDARMNYSAALNRANRNDEAAAQIREAMRIDPKSIETRVYLALVLAASGRNKEAADAAIGARDIDARLSNEILSKALQMSPAENNLDGFIAKMNGAR